MKEDEFLSHIFDGEQIPNWVQLNRSINQFAIPDIHPAHELLMGGFKIQNGVIFEYIPNGSRNSALIAGIEADNQPALQIMDLDDEDNVNDKEEENKWYLEWLSKYVGHNLSNEKRNELLNSYINLEKKRERRPKPVGGGINLPNVDKGLRKEIAAAAAKIAQTELQLFSDQPDNLPKSNPLYKYRHDQIHPEKIRELEKGYEEFLKGSYISEEKSVTNRIPADIIVTHKGITEKYYKENAAFYQYMERNQIAYFDSDRLHRMIEILQGDVHPANGSTWGYGEKQITHYEFRVYTAEHGVWGLDAESAFVSGATLVHVSVVAGVWTCFRQKITETIWENGNIKETKDYTLLEERFDRWLVGNGCSSTYRIDDTLILRYCRVFHNYGDLLKFAYGTTPSPGGYYYPIRADAYCIGTYGIDWVCHQLANAFTLRRWNIIVYPNSNFRILFGLSGRKGISHRKDFLNRIHHGCIPGNECFFTMVPPYATDPIMSAAFAAATSGVGWGLDYFWNPLKNEYRPTEADWNSSHIPFSGPSRTVRILGWVS